MFANTFSRRSAVVIGGPGTAAATAAAVGGTLCWMTERHASARTVVSTQRWASKRLLQTLQQQQQRPQKRPQQYQRQLEWGRSPWTRPLTTESTASTAQKPSVVPPPTDSGSGGGGGFVKWYEGHLQSHPIPTKMVTGCLLWSAGDAVAQVGPRWAAATSGSVPQPYDYDWERTGRAALFGFALHAPLSHLHFNFLEWMTVQAGLTGLSIPIFKTIMVRVVLFTCVLATCHSCKAVRRSAVSLSSSAYTLCCYHS